MSDVNISKGIISVHLTQPFATARHPPVGSPSAVIRIEHEGVTCVREADTAANACGGTAEPVAYYVNRIGTGLSDYSFPPSLTTISSAEGQGHPEVSITAGLSGMLRPPWG